MIACLISYFLNPRIDEHFRAYHAGLIRAMHRRAVYGYPVIGSLDMPDILPDFRHFLNSPPLLAMQEEEKPGFMPSMQAFYRRYRQWLDQSWDTAEKLAGTYRLEFTSGLMKLIRGFFEECEAG